MKSTILTLLFLIFLKIGNAQEFKIYPNGLIYDTLTMSRLSNIVDSLNLEFKSCDLDKKYLSMSQGYVHVVKAKSKKVVQMIQRDASFDELIRKYPWALIKRNHWILKRQGVYEDSEYISYGSLPAGYSNDYRITLSYEDEHSKNSRWVYSEAEDLAFYLVGLSNIEIPEEYARWIQYVDCMIDTTSSIYLTDQYSYEYSIDEDENKEYKEFLNWANDFPDKPVGPEFPEEWGDDEEREAYYAESEIYFEKYGIWDSLRLVSLDRRMQNSEYYRDLLTQAKNRAYENKVSNSELENYVIRYLSKEEALELKRRRRLSGRCSMDRSPRVHAMQISTLAAETARWDIFLRAHLDIMNDNFSRMTDGSYAWAARGTYIKEIEELRINALDMLIGSCLKSSSTSENHYSGNTGRIGRALAEFSDLAEVERRLFNMVDDPQLDPYNRLLMGYMISHFQYYLEDEVMKKRIKSRLSESVRNWPEHLKEAWDRN